MVAAVGGSSSSTSSFYPSPQPPPGALSTSLPQDQGLDIEDLFEWLDALMLN